MSKAISFPRSSLNWCTLKEKSHGIFRLESVLYLKNKSSQEIKIYCLSSSVPAGRMYSYQGPLIKRPSYMYQIIGGEFDHHIIRTPLEVISNKLHLSTVNKNIDIFKEFDISLFFSNKTSIQGNSLSERKPEEFLINFLIEWENKNFEIKVESPLKHWNYRANPSGWQVESGLILWPINIDSFIDTSSSGDLNTAWLHANQSDLLTITFNNLEANEVKANLSFLIY